MTTYLLTSVTLEGQVRTIYISILLCNAKNKVTAYMETKQSLSFRVARQNSEHV